MNSRFWNKVNKTETCWLWTASLTHNGYGRYHNLTKIRAAHRFAYETLVGPIPNGLQLDHLCRVRHCVNPGHLEVVTPRENTLRGLAGVPAGKAQKAKKYCPRGHEYTKENTHVYNNKRHCKECRRLHWKTYSRPEK